MKLRIRKPCGHKEKCDVRRQIITSKLKHCHHSFLMQAVDNLPAFKKTRQTFCEYFKEPVKPFTTFLNCYFLSIPSFETNIKGYKTLLIWANAHWIWLLRYINLKVTTLAKPFIIPNWFNVFVFSTFF